MRRILGLAVACWLACGVAGAQTVAAPVQAENAFAVDLYGQLRQQPGNLFFSPYSISTALEMVFVGARGQTAAEIAKVLHLEMLQPPGGDLRAAVLANSNGEQLFADATPDGFKFNTANALWGAAGYKFNPTFISEIKDDFRGEMTPVDFGDPAGAAGEINGWVAKQTQGKIQNLISPAALTAATRLVLTNAVYFKAGWALPFALGDSDKETFHVSAGHDVLANMMHKTDHYELINADGLRILSIPYRDGDASLVILLPDRNAGLAAVEAGLTADKLAGWLNENQYPLVALTLPRIQNTQQFDLNGVLVAMGIKQAFDQNQADLSGIADITKARLYISDVIHKANVDIDEQGTQAAAATAVIVAMAGVAAPIEPPPVPVPFVADHPFIYLIRANHSGEILFMGRVDDPTQTGD